MSNLVELYKFVQDGTEYNYTSANQPVDYDGDTYAKETIGRGPIVISSELNRNVLSVTVPRTNQFGADYIAYAQESPIAFTLHEQKDGATSIIWKGSVVSHKASGSEVTLECESRPASQRRSGNRARTQKPCRHALYQRGCNLDEANFDVTGTCTSADGLTAEVTEAASSSDGHYNGGMIEYGGVQRNIMSHTGDTLTLMSRFKLLEDAVAASGSVSVLIYEGCAHNPTACVAKSNILNCGCFSYIAPVNPFTSTTIL